MWVLLLAPDAPGGISKTGKQQSTTNTTNDSSNCFLGAVAEATGASAASVTTGQRSRINAGSNGNDAAAGAGDS